MVSTPEAVRASLRILTTHRALFRNGKSRGWGISMTEADISRVIRVFESQGRRGPWWVPTRSGS